jgi:hypothetical protein
MALRIDLTLDKRDAVSLTVFWKLALRLCGRAAAGTVHDSGRP